MAESAPLPAANSRRKTTESLTRDDWISGAWDMLGVNGLDGVRVEPLARRLGVTKGSFYWHFKDRQQLVEALLDRWFLIWDDQMSPRMEQAADPADRVWALFESVVGRVTRGQTVSLRMLSHSDADVARRIEERDAQRLAFLMEQLVAIGFSSDEARVRGQVYQTIMTGEYLRSGGLPLEERIARARSYHLMLSSPNRHS
ncbi:MAG: TetR/AcrR family transcriptional regulator [Alphaproteobacteria bacterium]|nr:TetR/AcrR family transcriptional regulator [Alphaproteobacteria bacterium]